MKETMTIMYIGEKVNKYVGNMYGENWKII